MAKKLSGRALSAAIICAQRLFGGDDPQLAEELSQLRTRHREKWCRDQEAASSAEFDLPDPPWGLNEEELFTLLSNEQLAQLRAEIGA